MIEIDTAFALYQKAQEKTTPVDMNTFPQA